MIKKVFRIVLDLIIFILLIVCFDPHTTGQYNHEIIGVVLLVLGILHIALNYLFYWNMFRGKYTVQRLLWTILDVALCIVFIATILSGLAISTTLVNNGLFQYRGIHKLLPLIWLILTSIHAGLHLVGLIKNSKNKKVTYSVLGVLFICSIFGLLYQSGNQGFQRGMQRHEGEFGMMDDSFKEGRGNPRGDFGEFDGMPENFSGDREFKGKSGELSGDIKGGEFDKGKIGDFGNRGGIGGISKLIHYGSLGVLIMIIISLALSLLSDRKKKS